MDYAIPILAGSLIIASLVGALTGIFGVGGGFLITPALMIILSIPGPIAVGTGLAVILVTSSLGLYQRRRTGTVDVKLACVISLGSVPGVFLGQRILESIKDITIIIAGYPQPAVAYVLLWCFLALLISIACFLVIDYHHHKGAAPDQRVGLFARLSFGPHAAFTSLEQPRLPILPLILMGLIIGILTGMLGIGGGVLLLPMLIYLVGQRISKAAGTSLVLVWISAILAVILHGKSGNIAWQLWIPMLIGGLTGTYFGTHLGLTTPGPRLRLAFVYVVAIAVALVIYKLFTLTFVSPS